MLTIPLEANQMPCNKISGSCYDSLPLLAKTINIPSFSECSHAWSYFGKMALITRHFMNALARDLRFISLAGVKISEGLKSATIPLKLFSGVSVPFSLSDIKTVAYKIFNSLMLFDCEGIALGSISFTIIAADIVDSFTTFANAVSTLFLSGPIAIFSELGLPLAFTMSGLGTVSRTIQIAKGILFYRSIEKEIMENEQLDNKILKTFVENALRIDNDLKSLLSISPERLTSEQQKRIELKKENNKAAILRVMPDGALNDLNSIFSMLDTHEGPLSAQEMQEIKQKFQHIQLHIIKKIKVDGIFIAGNLFTLSALALFSIGVASSLPFALLTIAFSIKLGVVFYQDQKI